MSKKPSGFEFRKRRAEIEEKLKDEDQKLPKISQFFARVPAAPRNEQNMDPLPGKEHKDD